MHISKLTIRNFRNFYNATFRFNKGVNTLVGENASGKTNAFYAIRLILDDSLPLRARRLQDADFNRGMGQWRGHWVVISIEFDELDPSEEAQVLAIHGVGDMEGNSRRGVYTYIFRPKHDVRTRLYELSQDNNRNPDDLARIRDAITIDDYEARVFCRGNADFSEEETYRSLVGEFEKLDFPDPSDLSAEDLGVPAPFIFSLQQEVSCTFIRALRDAVAELGSVRQSPLIGLLRGDDKSATVKDAQNLINQVAGLNRSISSLPEVRKVSDGIRKTLVDAVGKTYCPLVDIKSGLPDDIERLLQSLSLWAGDPRDGGHTGRIWEVGLGGANLIYLSLKLLEYELKQATDRVAHFLLIEEPEAHLHTHLQKTLFRKLEVHKTQVIISTHSTHISDVSRISKMNVLCREAHGSSVYHPADGLEPSQIVGIERYLDAIRSTILFARSVILVEGDAEMILVPAMIERVFGVTLDELGISLINMSSTVFEHVALIFHPDRIQRRCAIVTDLDKSIVPLKRDPDEDTDFQKKCRASRDAGRARKEKLDGSFSDNPWVHPFYAPHTFEVDFLAEDNSWEVCKCLEKIYKRNTEIEKSKALLEDEHTAVLGKEVLRLADKCGKGWLALLVAEQVNVLTNIPEYILEALAFVTNIQENDDVLVEIGRYRMGHVANSGCGDDIKEEFATASGTTDDTKTPQEFLEAYQEALPEDVLTRLRSLADPE